MPILPVQYGHFRCSHKKVYFMSYYWDRFCDIMKKTTGGEQIADSAFR